ncbi:MAG: diaminopimelate decarboxylase [Erysipelothrix sp.]|nr:diaminopimelate decarboxylase [Erysipelothrix sp.]
MKFHGTMTQDKDGLVSIGGVDVQTLKETYGTPLYIYDEKMLEDNAMMFKNSFKHDAIQGIVAYASKAFLTLAMARLINDAGLSIDVASEGELYTVYKAGFDMSRVYFHGNNKTPHELALAIELKCGHIILDNEHEVDLLSDLLSEQSKQMNVYLRVNPGIDVLTHDYIKTSKLDSKFGVGLEEASTIDLIKKIYENDNFNFKGLHAHIGSQIHQEEPFFENVSTLLKYYKTLETHGIHFSGINIGGGFGIYYTKDDKPIDLKVFLKNLIDYLVSNAKYLDLKLDEVIIEPGRSMVSNAGSTLYTVGSTKLTPSGKEYIFIDGGMSDNPRVALYQAEYEAIIANRNNTEYKSYAIAGKLCESGDILSHDTLLNEASPDDLLLMSSTGAYTYSMSSNYNRLTRPAVVFVKEGQSRLVVKRQTLDDLIGWDL